MRRIAFCFLAVVAASAFAAPKKGKLMGHVDVGPISPVQRVGQKTKVSPEVYKRYFVMVSMAGPHNSKMQSHLIRIIANLKLFPTGDYSTDLDPGEYQVGVATSQRTLTIPVARTVTIKPGKTTHLNLTVDTGIR